MRSTSFNGFVCRRSHSDRDSNKLKRSDCILCWRAQLDSALMVALSSCSTDFARDKTVIWNRSHPAVAVLQNLVRFTLSRVYHSLQVAPLRQIRPEEAVGGRMVNYLYSAFWSRSKPALFYVAGSRGRVEACDVTTSRAASFCDVTGWEPH